jgi:hypothetical protein
MPNNYFEVIYEAFSERHSTYRGGTNNYFKVIYEAFSDRHSTYRGETGHYRPLPV